MFLQSSESYHFDFSATVTVIYFDDIEADLDESHHSTLWREGDHGDVDTKFQGERIFWRGRML